VPNYAALQNKKAELIRKATDGSLFLAAASAPAIGALTTDTAGVTSLTPLPTGYDDLGWVTSDGAAFSRDVSTSDITSWGSVSPTRSDITADTTTLTVVPQETKLQTIALATGADLAAITSAATTGEVRINKPLRASARSYRVLVVAVDETENGEIYVARFLPRAKVTGFAPQNLGGGDNAIEWGVTFTAEPDGTLGYSESWIFGGEGWNALLTAMDIPAAA
jgi:hypothetical protein